jgi:hypothetical protein
VAKTRVIFIPWEKSDEFDAKSEQWNDANTKGDKLYLIVNYAPGVKDNAILTLLTAKSNVYVRGHGQIGGDKITADGRALPITEACQRLIDMGLNKNYQGTIKFFNCYSALRGPGGKEPTAEQGADYFRSQGFISCKFQGYEGPLRSEYEAIKRSGLARMLDWFDSYDHKLVAVQTEIQGYPGSWQPPKGEPKIRASDGRKDF